MANEIQFQHVSSGVVVDCFIRNTQALIWSTGSSSFVSYTKDHRPSCKIPLSEQDINSKYYIGNFPTAILPGYYQLHIFQRLGAQPIETDTPIGAGDINWNGTGVIDFNRLPVNTVQISGSNVTVPILQNIASGDYVYYADIKFNKDNTNSQDEYTIQWFRNTAPLSSGAFTSPTIQVIKRADGTDLIASASMDHVSVSIGTLKKNEASNRTTAGEDYIVKAQASIDGSTRTWQKLIGRDA